MLNEIGISGGSQFIELKNVTTAAVNAAGVTFRGAVDFRIAEGVAPVPPNGVLAVFFGGAPPDDSTVHVEGVKPAAADGGCVEAVVGDTVADTFCWGSRTSNPLAMGRGGRGAATASGSSFGRTPDSTSPHAAAEWRSFFPSEASPGKPNAHLGIVHGLPMSGASLDAGVVELAWYAMPAATGYRLEINSPSGPSSAAVPAAPDAMGGSLVRHTVTLSPGVHRWSVTTTYATGDSAPSRPQALFLRPRAVASIATPDVVRVSREMQAAAIVKELPVPLIYNHRDTSLLSLEAPDESGAKAWDRPWQSGVGPFCGRAAIAMVTKYYGGDLSQDRISYEAFKDFSTTPKFDLYIGGFSGANLSVGLKFAVGGAPIFDVTTLDDFMSTVRREIDRQRPIVGSSTIHVWVIIGYGEDDRGEYVIINDPALGRTEVVTRPRAEYEGPVNDFVGEEGAFLDIHFLMPDHPAGKVDEPEIHLDSDGDGLMDFDESRRFGTSPQSKDTDADGIDDKAEIRAWVWDPELGWHAGPLTTAGVSHEDDDHDDLPMQTDADSDNGGCLDGVEDRDHDGHHEPADETSVFTAADDGCVAGTYLARTHRTSTDGQVVDTVFGETRATFSLQPADGGRVSGVAAVTSSSSARVSGGDPCALYDTPLVTRSWQVTLAGEMRAGVLSLWIETASPDISQPLHGCGGTELTRPHWPDFFIASTVTFTDGRFDSGATLPMAANETGESFWELHVRQPGVR